MFSLFFCNFSIFSLVITYGYAKNDETFSILKINLKMLVTEKYSLFSNFIEKNNLDCTFSNHNRLCLKN